MLRFLTFSCNNHFALLSWGVDRTTYSVLFYTLHYFANFLFPFLRIILSVSLICNWQEYSKLPKPVVWAVLHFAMSWGLYLSWFQFCVFFWRTFIIPSHLLPLNLYILPEDSNLFCLHSYDDAGFKINNVKYEGSLLIVENKIMTWTPKTFADITAER